ncbi:unnamed protein product [Caenorhabditis angaria]|uniref:Uncharacterized protein n=1 Tax=Caenorhabditis angaria TaxID=860376 RepID=A0A9P1ID62_9PELO|nr:unnamed protein product [Caenorhabditis angaria]
MIHHLAEIFVVLLHIFVNLNRLSVLLYPQNSGNPENSKSFSIFFFSTGISVSAFFVYSIKTPGLEVIGYFILIILNFLNLFLEIKLNQLSKKEDLNYIHRKKSSSLLCLQVSLELFSNSVCFPTEFRT